MTAADLSGFSTSTAHRIVHRVSAAIASLRAQHIYFPELPDEIRQTQTEFYKKARFPYVIGAIDCTHIKFMKSPGGEYPELFRNRKHYFSLNVQVICNAKMEFTDIVARWPGSTHDSYIFNNSYRRALLDQGRYGSAVLIGDAGYGCNNFMMTPFEQCITTVENIYNEAHIRTRNCIERSFGVWKRRFPAMAIGLGVSLQNSFPIIIATAVLHNIALRSGETTPPNDNQVINPAFWDTILALGNINNGSMDAGRSHRNNPNYRRRSEIVNYFRELAR